MYDFSGNYNVSEVIFIQKKNCPIDLHCTYLIYLRIQ